MDILKTYGDMLDKDQKKTDKPEDNLINLDDLSHDFLDEEEKDKTR